jgi:hypothetical protein
MIGGGSFSVDEDDSAGEGRRMDDMESGCVAVGVVGVGVGVNSGGGDGKPVVPVVTGEEGDKEGPPPKL